MWADRQGSGQLRGLVSTGWAKRPGLDWFRQWGFPVLSPITTSFSDLSTVPASVSLHGSEACPDPPRLNHSPCWASAGRYKLAVIGAPLGLPGPALQPG